jgi:RND family efflux transporter MFP subunit
MSIVLLAMCWGVQAQTKPPVPASSIPQVTALPTAKAADAKPLVVSEQRDIRAQLTARRFTTLAAEVGAKISHLPLPEGSRFKAGQVLVRFDCSLPQAQLNKSLAALAGATATWNANKRLLELNSIGKVELEVSEAEVQKNAAEVSSMKAILGKCSIAAPYSGFVSEQKVREQQYVQAGQVLMEIIDDSALELEFIAPSRWLAWLKPGHAFKMAVDETGRAYPAKVLRLGGKVDPVSQSIKVTAVIDGKFADLLTGMSGRIQIDVPSPK